MLRSLITAATAAVIATTSASALAEYKALNGDPDELNFGIIATETSMALRKQWEPLLDDMEKFLGMKVKPFFASDYAGVIEGMRFGKVHMAWYGNKSGMEAVDRAGAEIFVQRTKPDGEQGYNSLLIAHVDNKNINSMQDVLKCDKSLDFGIGDPNSTSGFLVPSFYVFAKNDADPKNCFKTVRNANHGANLMAVANGQVDVATNNTEQLKVAQRRTPEVFKKLKVVWTSPLIPSDPIAYRRDLSKDMKARIKAFFLSYGRFGPNADAERKILANVSGGSGPFVDSSNAQLYPIRELALFKDRTNLMNNDKVDAETKKQKLAEIDAKLAELRILSKTEMM